MHHISGYDADGNAVHEGSRLATYYRQEAFTMGTVLDIAEVEFARRDNLGLIMFRSLDHIKAKRLAKMEMEKDRHVWVESPDDSEHGKAYYQQGLRNREAAGIALP